MLNRRGFFGRLCGLLCAPVVSGVPAEVPLRDDGSGDTAPVSSTPSPAGVGKKAYVRYYMFYGDSQWKRVDLCDLLAVKEVPDVSVQA